MPEYPGNNQSTWATNPKTVAQALQYAHNQAVGHSSVWYLRCLAFVGSCYGLPFTGTHYAIDLWRKMPANLKHPNDKVAIPDGALLFYDTGKRAGHVALYAGNGNVYSNDICHNGQICLTPFNNLTNGKWRLKYLGWTPPYFVDNPSSKIGGTVPDSLGAALTPDNSATLNPITAPFTLPYETVKGLIGFVSFTDKVRNWASNKQNWLWLLLIIIGLLAIGIAVYRFMSRSISSDIGTLVKAVTK